MKDLTKDIDTQLMRGGYDDSCIISLKDMINTVIN